MFVITAYPPGAFERFLEDNGIARYRARQALEWIYKKAVFDFSDFKNLPSGTIDFLKSNCKILTGRIEKQVVSHKDQTVKFLIGLSDGDVVESVLLPAEDGRLTVCLSTQVGCVIRCAFCASGRNGFKRNLSTSEIVSQYLLMRRQALNKNKDITNIVFMGIGEPLLNYDNLIGAVELLTDPGAANMSPRRITVSTAGVVPAINRLADYKKQINLSISLHSAFDKKRSALVSLNRKYNIKTLIRAVNRYIAKTGRMATFEYVLMQDVNDSPEDARQLGSILRAMNCKVNLIPYNPVRGIAFKAPTEQKARNFMKLLSRNNVKVIPRQRKGCDINSGCGQLKAFFVSLFVLLTVVCSVHSVSAMSDETELSIGRMVDAQIKKDYGVIENSALQKYIEHVGLKLVSVSDRPDIVYHFSILNSDTINSLCAPGGYVYITKGLLAKIETEAELAAALGCEIVHIAKRHGIKNIEMATRDRHELRHGATVAYSFVKLGYGKKLQTEADIKAAEYLLGAGYDPSAMIKFIDVIQVEEKLHPKLVKDLLLKRHKTARRVDAVRLMLVNLKSANPTRYNSVTGNLYPERYKENVRGIIETANETRR